MDTIKHIVFLVFCVTVINCLNLSKRENDKTIVLEGDQLDDYQTLCNRYMKLILPELRDRIFEKAEYLKFVYPCDECYVKYIEFGKSPEGEMFGTLHGDDFYSNTTIIIKKYVFDCYCHVFIGDEDISKALDTFKNEHLNTSCTKIDEQHSNNFNQDKIRACFHPKENDPDRKDPKIKITLAEESVDIKTYMKDTFYIGEDNEQYIKYDPLFNEIKEHRSPQVTCNTADKDDSYEAKSCSCLKKSGFFDVFPYVVSNHFFRCGITNKIFNETKHIRSCHDAALDIINELP